MAISQRTLSDFLQHSGEVLPQLEQGEVLLHRRNGEDLVLSTKTQRDAVQVLLLTFMRAANGGAGRVAAAVQWFGFLSDSDQEACLKDLREVAAVWLETGRSAELIETLHAWRATALASWDSRYQRANALDEPDEPLSLARPG
jgi:hypothetical protein